MIRHSIEINRPAEEVFAYLDQVANFIVQNTQGATIGQQTQTPHDAGPGAHARARGC